MLVRASSNLTPSIIHDIKRIEGVVDAYPVFGRFDAVVFIKGKDFPEMKNVAIKVTHTKGIRSTETFTEGV
jgi:hypothetical protein